MPLRTETAHVAYPSLTDTLADRLLRKIEDEKLMPGDYVATEGALAEEFGVSVRVLREAVARLRGLGILRAKQGVGLLVARPNPTTLLGKALPVYAAQSESLEDLYLFRRSIELGAIDLAVRNASDQQVAKLLALGREYEQVVKGGGSRTPREKLGLTFHRTILEAAGNEFLKSMAGVVEQYFVRAAREVKDWSQTPDRVSHLDIAQAFETRDAGKAWRLMSRHLRLWKRQ